VRKWFLAALCFVLCAAPQVLAWTHGAGLPQIFYNIVTDGGASCNGDVQTVTRTTSITSGGAALSVTTNTFSSGDVGKEINIPGAASGGDTLFAKVQAFTDAQHVTLDTNAGTTLSAVSTAITYGTDDAPKFVTFNTWARANQGASNQVVLTIPNGKSCWFGSASSVSGVTLLNAWAAGIHNLIVEGTGATINSVNGFGFQLGGQGIVQIGISPAGGQSARIQSVSAGATQITLTSASLSAGYISRFSAGRWIMLGGLNTQALWNSPFGFPPNLHYFEWRQITNVNAGTGVITFDKPLSNSYLSTWPLYNDGDAFEVDAGGPATIYALNDTWNTTVEYRGLTISQDGQTYAQSRNVTYRNVTFTGANGGIPTQNETWSAINTTCIFCNMEVDKLIGTVTLDTATWSEIKFQSSSTDLLVMRNSTVTLDISGTPKQAQITDSTIASLSLNAFAYGVSPGPVVCTRCAIASFVFDGGISQSRAADYSMSSGVISFANTNASSSDPDQRVFAPGANIFWAAPGFTTIGLFQSQALTQDATNIYIQTNEAAGFPSITGTPQFHTSAVPQFTCDACTGDPTLVATNIQSGATAATPLAQYSQRTFTPTSAQGNLGSLFVKGKIVSLDINVTQAYTGSGSATLNPTGQFHQFTVKQSNWTTFDWFPVINLKQAGERIITPSGVTCNGVSAPTGCAGDSLGTALPEAVWIQDSIVPFMGSTLSGGTAPTFTITAKTDQGVVP